MAWANTAWDIRRGRLRDLGGQTSRIARDRGAENTELDRPTDSGNWNAGNIEREGTKEH